MKSEQLIKMLQGDTLSRKKGIELLVQDVDLCERIKNMVKSKGANASQAQDIYHDVIMATVKAAVKRKPIEDLQSYMYGIARFKWYDTLKAMQSDRTEQHQLEENSMADETVLNQVLKSERAALLHSILDHLSARCKEVLLLWGSGYNMTEIAERLEYKSPGMVRKKKSNCLKSLVQFVESRPSIKETLKG